MISAHNDSFSTSQLTHELLSETLSYYVSQLASATLPLLMGTPSSASHLFPSVQFFYCKPPITSLIVRFH